MENSNQQNSGPLSPAKQSFFDRLANSVLFKLSIMLILVLFLLIPMSWINDLISERNQRERIVSQEISSKWGEAQVVSGPIIGIPYNYQYTANVTDDKGKTRLETFNERKYVFLAAKQMQINSQVEPEYLKRGIYQRVVYNSQVQVKGDFEELDLSKLDVKLADLQWEHAKLFIGLSDLKGLTGTPKLNWAGKEQTFQIQQEGVTLFERTLSSDIDLSARSTKGHFEVALGLRGSGSLTVFPTAEESKIEIKGNWGRPSFNGGFLPAERTVTDKDFVASWSVPGFNRKFSQQWVGGDKLMYSVSDPESNVHYYTAPYEEAVSAATDAVGQGMQLSTEQDMVQVNFLETVNNYQKTTRVAKYGILVILLTFTSLFFTEILKKKRIHFIQYILIGCAMVLFYSLLLAIGEHLGFNWSYLIASIATTGLIASFIYSITQDRKICIVFSGILFLFYAFVYFLLQLQDFSLIVGSIGLFIILAVLMRLSTRINWDQFERNS